jgi:hypothetical protein
MRQQDSGSAIMKYPGRKMAAAVLTGWLAVSGLPALAQGLCGGVGDGGDWIGGSEAASDIATAPAYLEQMALVLMGSEHVALFSLSAPAEVRVEAAGRGAGDPVIDLRDAAGTIILSDDDSGGNGAARGEIMLDPGTYCLSMRSFDASPMTGMVRVGLTSHEALTEGIAAMPEEPGAEPPYCDPATATAMREEAVDGMLAEGVSLTGSASEFSFLTFRLDAPQMLTITAENESADPSIAVFDPWGNWIAENDDYNGLNSLIDFSSPLEPGTYCIEMRALSDAAAPITVTVKAYDAVAGQIAMYERGEAAPPLDGSYPVQMMGPLAARLRADVRTGDVTTWFAVDVAQGGLIVVEAVANGAGDPTLVLFDDIGRQVAFNDDANGTLDSMIAARVMPGTYLVGVRQLGIQSDVLTRMVFERYVPAQ